MVVFKIQHTTGCCCNNCYYTAKDMVPTCRVENKVLKIKENRRNLKQTGLLSREMTTRIRTHNDADSNNCQACGGGGVFVHFGGRGHMCQVSLTSRSHLLPSPPRPVCAAQQPVSPELGPDSPQ